MSQSSEPFPGGTPLPSCLSDLGSHADKKEHGNCQMPANLARDIFSQGKSRNFVCCNRQNAGVFKALGSMYACYNNLKP